MLRTARDVLVAKQSSELTGLAPLFASAHSLIATVEQLIKKEEEEEVEGEKVVIYLSERLLGELTREL